MTPKTREQHAALILFLYEKAVDNDYHRRLPQGHGARLGMDRALALALFLCRTIPFDIASDAELSGMLVGARMHNGTPRRQCEINFISDALDVAQRAHGPDYVTQEERERIDYLFQVQERGEFFVPGGSPETAKAPARFTGIIGTQKEPTDTPGMSHAWVVIYPEDGSDAIRLTSGQEYGLRPHERVSYAVIEGNSGQRYATAIRPFAPRKPLPNSTYDACGQADGSNPSPRKRGILIRSGRDIFVATQESNHQHWIATAGTFVVQIEEGDSPVVTYRLERNQTGQTFAVDIMPVAG
ncbi:hypothetical protein MARCHEWKA_01840 [Brevundimonas phage vB_BpoS-Marchewka]|uniref:Uncharacterized protein n=1 Tax=Brevundimonas phage vB_BpoS-Marchewka TaxID=2948604 RepID=A0A9E7N535_9CAUD|nr:hypothetical protein MARCHEWKA_01840 [Brevundimonas phage vB_BpoS-Marchewka]UTC29143.1 hypothetical protein BAMBUS_00600 [Brevundimonas phage vB_BpoS-Bambus]